jgi:hypothetical protein
MAPGGSTPLTAEITCVHLCNDVQTIVQAARFGNKTVLMRMFRLLAFEAFANWLAWVRKAW